MKTHHIIVASLALVAGSAGLLVAGPLAPPAGPVASTYKTLSEIEPRIAINAANTPGTAECMFQITLPGSYYLTEQIAVLPNKDGIHVAADNVTIDLNGFRIGGYPGSKSAIIAAGEHRENITVRNGLIGPCGSGIDLAGDWDDHVRMRVQDVTITHCDGPGASLGRGVRVGRESIVDHVLVSSCGAFGIEAKRDSNVTRCVVSGCLSGIYAYGSRVEQCVANNNKGHGITIGSASVAINNSCTGNGVTDSSGAGIYVATGEHSLVCDNRCSGNDRGIWTQNEGAIIVRNVCAGNTTAWWLAAGTLHGPIIDRANASTPTVIGSSAPDTMGSTHPNANFTY